MIDTSFLRQLDRFSIIVRKKVTSSFIGSRATPLRGRGMIYKDHAIYTPEEDFRAIDWRVFARTDKLYVKRFEEERNLTIHILIDNSGSMDFGTKVKKNEYASMIGLGFAHMALKNNERFVLSMFGEKLEALRPRKGKKQLLGLFSYLNKKKPQGKTNILETLTQYKKKVNTKSMIIIISDFLVDPKELSTALAMYKGHDIRLVQVLDQSEENLAPFEGEFKLQDLELGSIMKTYISPLLKTQYVKLLGKHRAEIKDIATQHKIAFYHFHTGQPVFDAFFEMMSEK